MCEYTGDRDILFEFLYVTYNDYSRLMNGKFSKI